VQQQQQYRWGFRIKTPPPQQPPADTPVANNNSIISPTISAQIGQLPEPIYTQYGYTQAVFTEQNEKK